MFSGKFNMALTVAEQPSQRAVTFSLVDSPFMRSFQGRWQARPLHPPRRIAINPQCTDCPSAPTHALRVRATESPNGLLVGGGKGGVMLLAWPGAGGAVSLGMWKALGGNSCGRCAGGAAGRRR